MQDRSNFFSIDVLRFLSSLLVFITHWRVEAGLGRFGDFGVEIFFVISGFVISRTQNKPNVFLKRRIQRIYLPFSICMVGFLFISLFWPYLLNNAGGNHLYVFSSLSLIPFPFFFGERLPLYSISWTLVFEIYFYLFFYFSLVLDIRGLKRFFFFIGSFLVLSIFVKGNYFSNWLWLCFLGGLVLGECYHIILTNVKKNILVVLFCLGIGILGLSGTDHHFSVYDRPFAWIACAILVVAGAMGFEEYLRSSRFLTTFAHCLGMLSYEFYLVHLFALGFVMRILEVQVGWLSFILSFLLAVTGSWLLHELSGFGKRVL